MAEAQEQTTGTVEEATEGFKSLLSGEVVEEPENVNEESTEELEAEQTEVEELEEGEEDAEEVETQEEELTDEQKYFLPLGEDGSDVEIPASDVQNYLLMQSDYTKKTQSLAEERKAIEAERNSIRAIQNLSGQLKQEYEALEQVEESDKSDEYWEQLKAENPLQFMIERQELQEKSRERESAQQRVFAMQQQLQEQQKLEHQHKLVTEAQKLTDLIPTWTDREVAEKEKQALMSYGRSQDYSDEELSSVVDARAISILNKARKWDELQNKKGNLKHKALQTPASASAVRKANAPKRNMTEFKKAELKLRKTGKLKDAANAFEQILTNQSR